MFLLKGILRSESQERILLYLLLRDSGYATAIADFFNCSLNPIQKQLVRLEDDGVVVSRLLGNIREYELNPRYAFYQPLKALLKLAIEAYPTDIQGHLLLQRRRPRKVGKPEVLAYEK